MSILLKDSETKENLLRAFAGESQARNRYVFSGAEAKKQNLYVVQAVFNYTADQEKEHGELFYYALKELAGSNIAIDANYPIDLHATTLELLRAAQHNEYEEWEHDYAEFGKVARQEGFTSVAKTFEMIAAIEKTHGDRFGHFADLIEKDKLFKSDTEVEWLCLNCGHIHTGTSVPSLCPVCKHDQGYFIRREFSPFTSK